MFGIGTRLAFGKMSFPAQCFQFQVFTSHVWVYASLNRSFINTGTLPAKLLVHDTPHSFARVFPVQTVELARGQKEGVTSAL